MKKNKYEVKQSNTSLYLMFGMLTMVVLYLAYVFYQINWVFYILSSIFIVCITSEGKPLAALIMYLLVSGLSLVLMPIPYALPYIIVFGHYGLAKYFLEKIRDKIVSFIAKILYFNAFCALAYFLIIATNYLPTGQMFETLPVWAMIVILQVSFVVYDLLLSFISKVYDQVIRKRMIQ